MKQNNEKKPKRRLKKKYRIASMIFLCALLVCSFTFAYFSSRDVVTNAFASSEVNITLLEPEWVSTGQKKAEKAEPGMWIEKDPYVYNDSEQPVYVRLKIYVKVKDDSGKYVEVDNTLYNAVINALYCDDESNHQSLLTDVASGNSAFYLDDGWFYYAEKDGETITCTALASGSSTAALFDGIQLPYLKKDFNNGVFNKDFRIDIVAQGIAADETLTFDAIKKSFELISA